jgi:hypothetical protein
MKRLGLTLSLKSVPVANQIISLFVAEQFHFLVTNFTNCVSRQLPRGRLARSVAAFGIASGRCCAIQRPLCYSRIEPPDVGSIPAGTGAPNAPGLTGHGVLLGGCWSGAAFHAAIMR